MDENWSVFLIYKSCPVTFGNGHVIDDVITLDVAWEDILWQIFISCGLTEKDSGRFFYDIYIYIIYLYNYVHGSHL